MMCADIPGLHPPEVAPQGPKITRVSGHGQPAAGQRLTVEGHWFMVGSPGLVYDRASVGAWAGDGRRHSCHVIL